MYPHYRCHRWPDLQIFPDRAPLRVNGTAGGLVVPQRIQRLWGQPVRVRQVLACSTRDSQSGSGKCWPAAQPMRARPAQPYAPMMQSMHVVGAEGRAEVGAGRGEACSTASLAVEHPGEMRAQQTGERRALRPPLLPPPHAAKPLAANPISGNQKNSPAQRASCQRLRSARKGQWQCARP